MSCSGSSVKKIGLGCRWMLEDLRVVCCGGSLRLAFIDREKQRTFAPHLCERSWRRVVVQKALQTKSCKDYNNVWLNMSPWA